MSRSATPSQPVGGFALRLLATLAALALLATACGDDETADETQPYGRSLVCDEGLDARYFIGVYNALATGGAIREALEDVPGDALLCGDDTGAHYWCTDNFETCRSPNTDDVFIECYPDQTRRASEILGDSLIGSSDELKDKVFCDPPLRMELGSANAAMPTPIGGFPPGSLAATPTPAPEPTATTPPPPATAVPAEVPTAAPTEVPTAVPTNGPVSVRIELFSTLRRPEQLAGFAASFWDSPSLLHRRNFVTAEDVATFGYLRSLNQIDGYQLLIVQYAPVDGPAEVGSIFVTEEASSEDANLYGQGGRPDVHAYAFHFGPGGEAFYDADPAVDDCGACRSATEADVAVFREFLMALNRAGPP